MLKNITLISIPFDQDIFNQNMGQAPSALKIAGLLNQLQTNGMNVKDDKTVPAELGKGNRIDRIARLETIISDLVVEAHRNQTLPVILGGDCINAIGVCAGLRRILKKGELGVVWFDAHGDFNTPETTTSGYLGGMPLACICGYGLNELRSRIGFARPIKEQHVLMLGQRDLDIPEKELLDKTNVVYLSPSGIESEKVKEIAQHRFNSVEGIYLHLDIDVIDPQEAPGVTYPAPHGIIVNTAIAIGRLMCQMFPLAGITLSAINPSRDINGKTVKTGVLLLAQILA